MKYTLEQLINHAKSSVDNANNNISKLTSDILSMDGMSGNKTRHLYNNICSLNNANYLEIGTWKGSSFISAFYENDINSIVIDNWAEFNGPKDEFISNVNKFCPNRKFNFIEKDCFNVNDDEIKSIYDSIDIYLYDGAHDYESQRKAITYYKHLFSKYFILIVDDFRSDTTAWANVKKGTYDGIEESGLIIHHNVEIITHQEGSGRSEFWNGFGLFLLENPNRNI
jgi:hypothetical protein